MFIIFIIKLREYTRIIFLIRSAVWSFGTTKVGVLDQAGDSRPKTPIVLLRLATPNPVKSVSKKPTFIFFSAFKKKIVKNLVFPKFCAIMYYR